MASAPSAEIRFGAGRHHRQRISAIQPDQQRGDRHQERGTYRARVSGQRSTSGTVSNRIVPSTACRAATAGGCDRTAWVGGCLLLPALATGMRSWIDRPYDALMIASFAGWEEPAHLIALARAIAGSRPLMVLTTEPSADERLTALHAGGGNGWRRAGWNARSCAST